MKDSLGEIIPPNRIVYEDCFQGIQADVRYTYTRTGLEQDVILRETPVLPEGFSADTSLLVVVTEFLTPPVPLKMATVLKQEKDEAIRATLAQPDLINEDLDFGAMQMRLGRAFSIGAGRAEVDSARVAVAKTWLEAAGRTFLMEQVEYGVIKKLLEKPRQASIQPGRPEQVAKLEALLPEVPKKPSERRGVIQVASSGKSLPEKGVVIDWQTVVSQSSFTFASGVTYLIVGSVSISSWSVIQANTFIKFDRNAYLTLSGAVYSPTDGGTAYLVSRDDKSVGEDTSTGSLSGYYANPAIHLYNASGQTELKRLQIRSASKAIDVYCPSMTQTVRDSQFMKCPQGIGAYYSTVYVTDNVMFEVPTPTYNYGSSYLFTSGTISGEAEKNTGHYLGNQAEAAVAINPTDLNNIVIVTRTEITPPGFMYKMRTTDGGNTWVSSSFAYGTDIDEAIGDPSLAFDSFGNLYLTYLKNNPNTDVILARSIDKGLNFSVIQRFDGETFCGIQGWPDQPTVVTGPGSAGYSQSVWLLFNRGNYCTGDRELVVTGAGVNGLGQIGSFISPLQIVTGSAGCHFGDIVVGPNGQVAVVYQPTLPQEGPVNIYFCLDSDGLGTGVFGSRSTIGSSNVGGQDHIPSQLGRTIDVEVGLAWDRSGGTYNGRLYLLYTDESPNESNNTDVYVIYSANNGMSWSNPVKVNDDFTTTRSQFLPRMELDQTTGKIAVCWYDCRLDSENKKTQFYTSVSSNGGASFRANFQVSGFGLSDRCLAYDCASPPTFDYGDYSAIAFRGGKLFPVWADNTNSTGDNPSEGGYTKLDIYTRKIAVP
ncbi:MAG: hypothetical protein AAB676_20920 [Verrucomicrobiota bacterium]